MATGGQHNNHFTLSHIQRNAADNFQKIYIYMQKYRLNLNLVKIFVLQTEILLISLCQSIFENQPLQMCQNMSGCGTGLKPWIN